MIECILNNLPNDPINLTEVYTDLQELFQNKLITGQKRIFEMIESMEKIENEKLLLLQQENNKHEEKIIEIRKSITKKNTKQKSNNKSSK